MDSSDSSSISPQKIRTNSNSTPLRRMNTVGSSSRPGALGRRKHSSAAAMYTPENPDQPMTQSKQEQQQEENSTTKGYRKLSIGSKTSPTHAAVPASDRVRKRMSGINFNIPVVAGGGNNGGGGGGADSNNNMIRSNSTSSSPKLLLSPTTNPNTYFEKPTRPHEFFRSPSPEAGRDLQSTNYDHEIPVTPTPVQKKFEDTVGTTAGVNAAAVGNADGGAATPMMMTMEDPLSVQLRELAAKEAELLEIKEHIKNMVNKKRAMEMEFDLLKKSIERTLHQQIIPSTTSKKSHSSIMSPRALRSPQRKSHHRDASADHPLDDNFNSITAPSSSSSLSHYQQHNLRNGVGGAGNGQDSSSLTSYNMGQNIKKQSQGLWGIISQVDSYIQNEFEKFNIIDANPNHSPSTTTTSAGNDYVGTSGDPISGENRIKKLLDGNSQYSLLPQSLKSVVDAVIYGAAEESLDASNDNNDNDNDEQSALRSLQQHQSSTSVLLNEDQNNARDPVVNTDVPILKPPVVEMEDFSKNNKKMD